jgi:hypothetical protein
MEIFATIGGVMTPKNRMRLSKGLIQINQLARMVYPKTADTKATLKVKYVTITITGTAEVLKTSWEHKENNSSLKISYSTSEHIFQK